MSRPPAWQPEHPVSLARAQALIAAQWPAGGEPARLVHLGAGWDNDAFLLGDWVIRFPRRAVAVPLLRTEAAVLPWIAERTGLPIPCPAFVGAPALDYPAPWAAYRRLPGQTADRAPLDDMARARLAAPLATWLSTLHALPPAEATRRGAPDDTLARTDLPRRLALAQERLQALAGPDQSTASTALMGAWRALPPDATAAGQAARVLVHGDLYSRHVLVDDGALSGLIDFGDLHVGDAALDLAVAWALLPRACHSTFRAAYGGVPDEVWARARFRAAHHAIAELAYAVAVDDAPLARAARWALDQLAHAAPGA